MAAVTRTLHHDGIALHSVDYQPDESRALVFVHGRCLSLRSWEGQLGSVALAGYRQVAFDLPGHGQSGCSDYPPRDYSLQGSIAALVSVIGQLHMDDFVLVGCSLGGHIVLQALPHLPRCRGVFALTMPITKPARFEQMYGPGARMGEAFTEQPTPGAIAAYLPLLLRPGAPVPAFLDEDFTLSDGRIHAAIGEGILRGEYRDETLLVQQSAVPVAVAAGQDEQIHTLSYMKDLSLPLWSGQPLYIPKAGHLAAWENPTVVNAHLCAFADDCFSLNGHDISL